MALHSAIILNYPTHRFKLAPLIREAASFLWLTCNQCADLFSYIHQILLQQPVLPQIKNKIPDAPVLYRKTTYKRKGSQYILFQTVTEQTENIKWGKLDKMSARFETTPRKSLACLAHQTSVPLPLPQN